MATVMACGGCGLEVEIVSRMPEDGGAAYSYTSDTFFNMVQPMMHEHDEFETVECPTCGHKWHFLNAEPLIPKIAHS